MFWKDRDANYQELAAPAPQPVNLTVLPGRYSAADTRAWQRQDRKAAKQIQAIMAKHAAFWPGRTIA